MHAPALQQRCQLQIGLKRTVNKGDSLKVGRGPEQDVEPIGLLFPGPGSEPGSQPLSFARLCKPVITLPSCLKVCRYVARRARPAGDSSDAVRGR